MGDLARIGDQEVRVVGTDGITPVDVVTDEDTQHALKVKGNVSISGSSGSSQTLSIANRMETNEITSSSGWNTVLNLTVTTGYTWYIKGISLGTTRTCTYRLSIGGTIKHRGNIDASDSFEVPLYGYAVPAGTAILLEMNTTANQTLVANIIIFEEAD